MIYFDTAALVKLVREESNSAELRAWLVERLNVPRVASVMVEVEVPRAIRRTAPSLLPRASRVLT